MYNPFKPHIVQFANGSFGIRKIDIGLGLVYYSQTGSHRWWYSEWFVMTYAAVPSRDKLRWPTGEGKRIV